MYALAPLSTPMSPQDALRRIAFVLEANRANSYRVKAFRAAAQAIARLTADDLAAQAAAGTLTRINDVGASSAAVITDAVNGRVPEYFDRLGPLPQPSHGAALYAAARGDLHSHTDWSDGGSSVAEMAATAAELGHEWLAITDHSPRLTVAHGLTAQRLIQQMQLIAETNADQSLGLALLTGIEVDILDDGTLDQHPDVLAELDVVTASAHSKLAMDAAAMTKRLVAAVSNPRVNVLGHCTGRLITGNRGTRAQSNFDADAVFSACAENNTAVEINSRPERMDPPDELIERARDHGCVFAINSDAHAPGQLSYPALGCERAAQIGIELDRIVTAYSHEQLIDWTTH